MRLPTVAERMALGKAIRKSVPRSSHGEWVPSKSRPDPIALLKEQNRRRVPDLVSIRYARMLESPLGFLRGSAIVMANDLVITPNTSINVQACGDCHLMNFGGYATPERNFVFDVNDFDETSRAPWEWDLKRLATSFVVAARHIGLRPARCEETALALARAYRKHIRDLAAETALDVWYSRLDMEAAVRDLSRRGSAKRTLQSDLAKARTRTPDVLLGQLTRVVRGRRRFIDSPPLVRHLASDHPESRSLRTAVERYRRSLRDDLRVLLDRYEVVDQARKVVGVGSVGTRCAILLLMARDDDALILQIKEATNSVLDAFAGSSRYDNHGERVVTGQRVMQAATDMFLGWTTYAGRDYYVRQLRDMKASVDLDSLDARSLAAYAGICGMVLARAHAKSGDAAQIGGYLGSGAAFDRAVCRFARKYADQTERDFAALRDAAKTGRIRAAKQPRR